ncbi:hypothetical protein LTR62_003381 [Meristemomyces frigidus]|uniref:C3H1-type domain-containing protein n=1 Tax=Meristemomyces frigidus TaxID=1508187 RepID=A0AAN7TFL5_9PEZI|nr:hypothetical protein LTR62_003381 [Meristemomyces frigidus]
MVICRFWQQGNCKFGDNCKNEHPGARSEANRYAPLSNGYGNNGARPRGGGGDRYRPGQTADQKLPYNLDKEAITSDLTAGGAKGERPEWPLSVYAPGRDAPRQLLEGAVEQSPEEMRLLCYEAKAKGQLEQYVSSMFSVQHEATLGAQVQQQISSILNDLDGAIKYVIDGEQQHPNRLDQVVKGSGTFAKPALGGFGQTSGTSPFGGTSTFGQSSNMAQTTSTFGQPSQPTTSAFGQPSNLGGVRSTFGQPSQPAAGGFGQPSQPSTGGFGQPSNFGANKSTFGQPSQPAFGQPSQSTFGQPSQPALSQPSQPAFGQPSQLAFGQPSQPAFGQPSKPAFGHPSQPKNSSPFSGQVNKPSPFATANTQVSPFAQPPQTSAQPQVSPSVSAASQTGGNNNAAANAFASKPAGSTFGTPSQPSTSTFGAPSGPAFSPFAQPPQPIGGTGGPIGGSGFGQPSQPATSTNISYGIANGFGASQSAQSSPAPQTNGATGLAATSSYTTRGRNGRLLMTWKGNQVNYQMDDNNTPSAPTYINPRTRKEEKIWFPDGPPERPNPYAEAAQEAYEGDVGKLLKQVYDMVREKEEFEDIVPELPPKREWVRWDL